MVLVSHRVLLVSDQKGISMGAETWLTPSEAAVACGVDVSTIRRRLRRSELPHARRRAPGESWCTWEIPLSSLVELGMCTSDSASPRVMAGRVHEVEAELAAARPRLEDLQAALDRMETLYERQQQLLDRYMVGAA